MRRATDSPNTGRCVEVLLGALPEVDRRVAAHACVRDNLADSFALAFRQGIRGQVHDWGIIATPWGFRPDDIRVPVDLYYGGLDDRVPLHHARDLAARIPVGDLTEYPSEGHMGVFSHAEEILIPTAGPRCALDAPALIAGQDHGAIIPPGHQGWRHPHSATSWLGAALPSCEANGCNSFQPVARRRCLYHLQPVTGLPDLCPARGAAPGSGWRSDRQGYDRIALG